MPKKFLFKKRIMSTFFDLMLLPLAATLHQTWKTTSLTAQMFHMFQVHQNTSRELTIIPEL